MDQLEVLKHPASGRLGAEREVASLLFDRKAAATFTSEEFLNLGTLPP